MIPDLRSGDRVRLLVNRAGYVPVDDPELSVAPYDARQSYNVPAGTLGTVILVRDYPGPFPFSVLFDNGQELNVHEREIERAATPPGPRTPPRPAWEGNGS